MSNQPLPRADGSRQVPLGDLLAFGSQIRADDTPESLLHEVAETLQRVVASAQVYVRLRNIDSDAFEAAAFAGVAPEAEAQLRSEPVLPGAYPLLLQPELRVSDSYLLPTGSPSPNTADTTAAPPDTHTLLVPLRGRGDRLIGVIYIALTSDAALDPTAAQIIEAIAR
ncbi:MAG: histidine kinase, partial [Oscillochloris sp.]|nr:histidine kinase [Oscillochloris sp.]